MNRKMMIAAVMGGKKALTAAPLRDPTAADDAAHGAVANMLWLNTATGNLFKATSVSNGAAVWAAQTLSAALPLDGSASENVVAAYGLKKLKAAYAGNCCVIQRASDNATMALGWSGNDVDLTGVAAWIAGTTARATTFYDQSGSARDATKTFATAPIFLIDAQGKPHLYFTSAFNLTMPAGVSVTNPNLSITVISDPQRLYGGNQFVNLGPNVGSTEYGLQTFANTTTYKIPTILAADPWGGLGTTPSENGPGVYGATSNEPYNQGVDIFCNEATSHADGTYNTDTFPGGQIGAETLYNGTFAGTMDAVIVHSAKLSAAARLDLYLRLYRQYGVSLQRAMNNLVAVGDSIVHGSGATGYMGWLTLAQKLLSAPPRCVNIGVPGSASADVDTNYAAFAAPLYVSAARRNVCVIAAGTNDLSGGRTAAQAWTSLQSIISKAVATGFKPLVCTILPLGASYETARTTLNASIRSGYTAAGAVGLIDLGGDSVMGSAGANTNETYFNTDHLHPNDTGHARLSVIAHPAIASALQ